MAEDGFGLTLFGTAPSAARAHRLCGLRIPLGAAVQQSLASSAQFFSGKSFTGGRIGTVIVREVVLAHELFHHLARTVGAPAAARPEVEVLRLGSRRRRAVVRAGEEIAAGFAAAWCGVDRAPELLDCLTLGARQKRPYRNGPARIGSG